MITFNGIKFARTQDQFALSLFESINTCDGFYTSSKKGITLLDIKRRPFAFIADNGPGERFIVSVHTTSAGMRYMYSTTNQVDQLLGLADLGHTGTIKECNRVIQEMNNNASVNIATQYG